MFFRKLHAKVQIIFDMCKYHQFFSQILLFYFTILLFWGFIYQLTLCVIPATFTEDLVARASLKVYRGPRKSVDFWGEEKWRQAKLAASFILQAHFDEGGGCNLLRSTS